MTPPRPSRSVAVPRRSETTRNLLASSNDVIRRSGRETVSQFTYLLQRRRSSTRRRGGYAVQQRRGRRNSPRGRASVRPSTHGAATLRTGSDRRPRCVTGSPFFLVVAHASRGSRCPPTSRPLTITTRGTPRYGSYNPRRSEDDVSLESDFEKAWTSFLTSPSWLGAGGNSDALHQLAALTAGSIQGLAAQIDRLRSDVVAKGLAIGE